MHALFALSAGRKVNDANYCHFVHPILHPSRRMTEHDLIYMIDGEWKIGQESETFTMRKNDVLILSAGLSHYGIEPCAPGTRTMYLHITAAAEEDTAADRVEIASHIHTSGAPHIRSLFEKIIHIHAAGDAAVLASYVDVLLYELGQFSMGSREDDLARDIRQLILATPDKILKNDEIAERFNVSKKTAESVFKRRYGVTVHQYALECKVEQAQYYLKNCPDMKLSEIAALLGFFDEYHLSRRFKSVCGISPSEYKQRSM